MNNFVAIDFETANHHPESVCSVGVVVVRNGEITDKFYSLIKPEPEYYNYYNSLVHGITESDTCNSQIFPAVWLQIEPMIEGLPFVAHNKSFDERCLKAVFKTYQMVYPGYEFHCTLQMSRKAFNGILPNYKLSTVAQFLGHDFNHHHALADAEACARIALFIHK